MIVLIAFPAIAAIWLLAVLSNNLSILSLDFFRIAVEAIKALAWPSVALLLIYSFRREIQRIIPNLTKFGLSGAEFQPGRQLTIVSERDLKELPGLPRTEALRLLEIELHRALAAFDPAEHVDLLIRHLAQARLEAEFERIYRGVFESQIEALRKMVAASGPITRDDAIAYFNEVRERHPDFYKDTFFEAWAAYLLNNRLVQAEADKYSVTALGTDFLAYINGRSLPPKNW